MSDLIARVTQLLEDETVTELDLTEFANNTDVQRVVEEHLRPRLKRFLFRPEIRDKLIENAGLTNVDVIEQLHTWVRGFDRTQAPVTTVIENPRDRVWDYVQSLFSATPQDFPDLGDMTWNRFKLYRDQHEEKSLHSNVRHELVYPFMNDLDFRNVVIALWLEYGCWDECRMYIKHFQPGNLPLVQQQVSKLKNDVQNTAYVDVNVIHKAFVYAIIGMYDTKTFPTEEIMTEMQIHIHDFKPMIRTLHNENLIDRDADEKMLLRIRWYHSIQWNKQNLPKCWCADLDNTMLFMDDDTPRRIRNKEELQWIMNHFFAKRPFPF